MKGDILVQAPGELDSAVNGGCVASTEVIKDYPLNKSQEDLNANFNERISYTSEVAMGASNKADALEDLLSEISSPVDLEKTDTYPTKGNTTHYVTSDGIYNACCDVDLRMQKYALKADCQNVYDEHYIRRGYTIGTSIVGKDSGTRNNAISGYYRIPEGTESIYIKIENPYYDSDLGETVWYYIRFATTPVDNDSDTNNFLRFSLGAVQSDTTVIERIIPKEGGVNVFGNFEYFTFHLFRGGENATIPSEVTDVVVQFNTSTGINNTVAALKDRSIDTYVNTLLKYQMNTPARKACVIFQMDLSSASLNNDSVYSFAERLLALGIRPTYYVPDNLLVNNGVLNTTNIKRVKKLSDMGCEVGIRSVSTDYVDKASVVNKLSELKENWQSFTPKTVNEVVSIVEDRVFPAFISNGIYPIGWVTAGGAVYEGGEITFSYIDDNDETVTETATFPVVDFVTPLEKYFMYASTMSNGAYSEEWDDPTDSTHDFDGFNPYYINDDITERTGILRWGIDCNKVEDAYPGEADVLKAAKKGIDLAISQEGVLVLYCHSLNMGALDYTLTETVFAAILDYLKSRLFSGQIIGGTTADVVKYYYDR